MRLPIWRKLVAKVLFLICVGLLSSSAQATAQSSTALADLTIALWPEYDRPEVLVIYQGELAPEVSLPATVSIEVPASVQQIHAVAYLDENINTLITLDEFRLEAISQSKRLTLTTPARRFHAEYYANGLLTRDGDRRTIHYVFTATMAIANFHFEVQQPVGAMEFVSDPMPVSIEKRGDNLSYAHYPVEILTAGTSRSLRVSYRRATDILSFDATHRTAQGFTSPSVSTVASTGLPLEWSTALVGSFFLGAGLGYFMRDRLRRRHPGGALHTGPVRHDPAAHYCYRCGARLYPKALYCHLCGTSRRNMPTETAN
ncbi:MAG: hypothetical protein ACP5R2_05315 [Anaerolineae bacterium]